jgi:hypothetical protein
MSGEGLWLDDVNARLIGGMQMLAGNTVATSARSPLTPVEMVSDISVLLRLACLTGERS